MSTIWKRLVLGAAVGMLAVTVGILLSVRKHAQRNVCLNNLRQLTGPMACCVPMANRLTEGDPLDPEEVCLYLKGGTMPVCPAGGAYRVAWVVGASNPTCSIHGDLMWETEGVRTLKELCEKGHASEDQAVANETRYVERAEDVALSGLAETGEDLTLHVYAKEWDLVRLSTDELDAGSSAAWHRIEMEGRGYTVRPVDRVSRAVLTLDPRLRSSGPLIDGSLDDWFGWIGVTQVEVRVTWPDGSLKESIPCEIRYKPLQVGR